jgi:glycerol uptake facilitator-like aquaporin
VPLTKRLVGEGLGTVFLLAAIVGSGIMGERLSDGNIALALLANALATGAALVALILTFGPISGAHFNPLVTCMEGLSGRLRLSEVTGYIAAQLVGALSGVVLAHAMFGEPAITLSVHERSGASQVLSEAVATFGLLGVISVLASHRPTALPIAVGAYITSAYWFTASTSFANPAVTLARALTDTFAGIRPADVPLFLLGQATGAALAMFCFPWLLTQPRAPLRTDSTRSQD